MTAENKAVNILILPADKCPKCDHELDAVRLVEGLEEAHPQPGDVTICAYCYTVLMWNWKMKLEQVFSGISIISRSDCEGPHPLNAAEYMNVRGTIELVKRKEEA